MKKVCFILVCFVVLGNAAVGLSESPFDEEVEKRIEDSDVQYMFSKYAKTKNADAMRLYKEGTYLINNILEQPNERERIEEGIHRLQKALELDPNFAAVHLSLGQAFIFTRHITRDIEARTALLEKAKSEYKKSVELDPKNADAHRKVGDLSDDEKELIYHYKMALEIDPEQEIDEYDKALVADSLGKVKEAFEHIIQNLDETPVAERCHKVKTLIDISKAPYGYGYFKKKYPKEYKAFVGRVCRGEGMPEYKPPCEECGD